MPQPCDNRVTHGKNPVWSLKQKVTLKGCNPFLQPKKCPRSPAKHQKQQWGKGFACQFPRWHGPTACCLYFRFLPSTTMRQCFCCFLITLIVVHCSINLGNWQENNESLAWAPCGRPKSPPSHLLCTVRCKELEVWPFTCLRTWCLLEHDVSCLPTLLKLSPFLLGNQTYKCVSPNSGVFFPSPRTCSQLPATLGGAIVWQLHDAIKLTKRILSVTLSRRIWM